MSLNRRRFRPSWHADYANTCDNDNGVLGLAFLIYLHGRDYNSKEVMDATESEEFPGLYLRSPSRVDDTNAHDNYIAMAAICIFTGDEDRFKTILKWWPNFNNKNPKRFQLRRGSPSGLHQPHAVFLYQLASGNFNPNWIRVVWHCAHLIVTAVYPRASYSHHSERCLAWLQIRATEGCIDKIPKLKRLLIRSAHALAEIILNYKVRKRGSLNWIVYLSWYYNTNHPIAVAAREASKA